MFTSVSGPSKTAVPTVGVCGIYCNSFAVGNPQINMDNRWNVNDANFGKEVVEGCDDYVPTTSTSTSTVTSTSTSTITVTTTSTTVTSTSTTSTTIT